MKLSEKNLWVGTVWGFNTFLLAREGFVGDQAAPLTLVCYGASLVALGVAAWCITRGLTLQAEGK